VVTAATEGFLAEILQITQLGPWVIDAKTFSRSTSIGVIDRVNRFVTTEELSNEIQSQVKIRSADHTIKKDGTATTCVKVIFEGPILSQEVCLGFTIHEVLKYIPEAIQCFKCRHFGHIAKACRGKQRCARCGEDYDTKTRQVKRESYKCVNCGGAHSSV